MTASDVKKVLFKPDTHRPFHDKKAWDIFIKAGELIKPDILVDLGDAADFYSVSSHRKDPRRVTLLKDEIDNVKEGFDELDSLGAEEKIFIGGNHEDRLIRFLQDKAPALFGLMDIPDLFELQERGWSYTPYKEYTTLGKIYATHDIGTATRYTAYKALEVFEGNVVHGHTHRFGYVVEGNAKGEKHVSANLGWLGDVEQVDYMNKAKALKYWTLGFGYGYLYPDGNMHIVPVPIVDYRVNVEGKTITDKKVF